MATKRRRTGVEFPRLFEAVSKAVLEDQALPLSEFPSSAVVFGLLCVCGRELWAEKETTFGEHLLSNLIRFCEELKDESQVWQQYNLVLTAIAGTMRGSRSERVLQLRGLNAGMRLQDLVAMSKSSSKIAVDPFQVQCILTGAALQGFIDVVVESKRSVLEIGDIIYLAQALLEPCGVESTIHKEDWFAMLHAGFNGVTGVLDSPALVMEPLKFILTELANAPRGSFAYDVFLDLLLSLTFTGLARASRSLFQAASSISQLSRVAMTLRIRLRDTWVAEDEMAATELRGLLHDICESGGKVCLDITPTETTRERLRMVMFIVQLYCQIVIKFVRSTPQRLLTDEEKQSAGVWLRGIETQARTAEVSGTRALDYKQAAGVILLALSLTDKPVEYAFGVPIW